MPLKRKVFTIKFLYFKPSGKFYEEATEDMDCAAIETSGGLVPYMSGVVQQLKSWGGTPLPGFERSCRWNGPVMIDCEDGFPVLILGGIGDPVDVVLSRNADE